MKYRNFQAEICKWAEKDPEDVKIATGDWKKCLSPAQYHFKTKPQGTWVTANGSESVFQYCTFCKTSADLRNRIVVFDSCTFQKSVTFDLTIPDLVLLKDCHFEQNRNSKWEVKADSNLIFCKTTSNEPLSFGPTPKMRQSRNIDFKLFEEAPRYEYVYINGVGETLDKVNVQATLKQIASISLLAAFHYLDLVEIAEGSVHKEHKLWLIHQLKKARTPLDIWSVGL